MDADKLMITVCLITYNHEKFIGSAIESILQQQTNFNWDILIADDCSTDGTRDILRSYEHKHRGRIRLLLQDRNVGMEQNFRELFMTPESKYLAFLDGDDVWVDSSRLQKQFNFLERNPAIKMVYGKGSLIDVAGNHVPYKKRPHFKSGYIFQDVLTCKYLPPMAASLMRNDDIKKMYRTGTEPGVDFYVITSICRSGKVAFMDEVFFCYRINAESITTTQVPFIRNLFLDIMDSYRKDYPAWVKKGIDQGKILLIYHNVEKKPNIKNLLLLIRNFRFSAMYFRQLAKCFINILKIKLGPAV